MLAQRMQLGSIARAGLTSGTVMGIADVLCQKINDPRSKWDWKRTARFSTIGVALHGPYFLLGFQKLDQVFGPATTLGMAVKKSLAGQVALFPLWLSIFFTSMALLEGRGIPGAVEKVQNNFGKTFATGSVFWPIVNVINFKYVPTANRVLYVNACGLVWNAFLSWLNSRQAAADAIQATSTTKYE